MNRKKHLILEDVKIIKQSMKSRKVLNTKLMREMRHPRLLGKFKIFLK